MSQKERCTEEIEVTPEMIEAGLDVFLGEYPDSGAGDRSDREMVRLMFKAMVTASEVPHNEA